MKIVTTRQFYRDTTLVDDLAEGGQLLVTSGGKTEVHRHARWPASLNDAEVRREFGDRLENAGELRFRLLPEVAESLTASPIQALD